MGAYVKKLSINLIKWKNLHFVPKILVGIEIFYSLNLWMFLSSCPVCPSHDLIFIFWADLMNYTTKFLSSLFLYLISDTLPSSLLAKCLYFHSKQLKYKCARKA